jgi:hypothetical protein
VEDVPRSIRLGRRWWRSAVDPPARSPPADARSRAWQRPLRIVITAATLAIAVTIGMLVVFEHGS